jgi:hypothetical protein
VYIKIKFDGWYACFGAKFAFFQAKKLKAKVLSLILYKIQIFFNK